MGARQRDAVGKPAEKEWQCMADKMQERGKELGLDQQIVFLRKVSFFKDFDDHELKQFLAVSKWLKVPKGALVIREGTTERAFYILVKGEAQVIKAARDRKSVVLTTLEAGDCFGEMAMVTEIRRTADVVASRDAFVLRVEPEIVSTSSVFLQLKFYKRFCEILVSRLALANRRMAGGETVADESTPPPEKPRKVEKTGEEASSAGEKVAGAGATEIAIPPARRLILPPMPVPEERLTASKIRQRITPDNFRAVNPWVAQELERLLSNGDGTENTRAFADLIGLDPVLTCKVIQTANSPFYRRATPVGTVPHAMVIIGIKNMRLEVERLIAETSGAQLFGGFQEVARLFWRHSVLVGKIAELLKEIVGVATSTDVYLAGLLHDLGMLALDAVMPGFYPQLASPEPPFPDLEKAEKEYIGVEHSKAGLWLGEQLGLPHAYLDVMQFHHVPQKATTNTVPVALVALADIFARERGVCLEPLSGAAADSAEKSLAWVLIQEQHKPFMDVNIPHFVASFREEIDKAWPGIAVSLPQ